MKNNIKNQNGITLVTLIATIIVILILAAIAIRMAVADGGILTQTTETVDAESVAQDKQKIESAIYSYKPYCQSNSEMIAYLRDISWIKEVREDEDACIIKLDNGNEYDLYDFIDKEEEDKEISLDSLELVNHEHKYGEFISLGQIDEYGFELKERTCECGQKERLYLQDYYFVGNPNDTGITLQRYDFYR